MPRKTHLDKLSKRQRQRIGRKKESLRDQRVNLSASRTHYVS